MILVDKDIKERVEKKELFKSGYDKNNLNGVSYDLRIDVICFDGDSVKYCELQPQQVVFIKTIEEIDVPYDLVGVIVERTSVMRLGLKVDGPRYQPGNTTYIYLRVQNISDKIIKLENSMGIAQIYFETLSQKPKKTYDKQKNQSFQNENEFVGLGSYSDYYKKKTKKIIEEAKEDISSVTDKLYSNMIAFMGIIAAIFSLIIINYQAFSKENIDFKFILKLNFSLGGTFLFLFGIILTFINFGKHKKFNIYYLILCLAFLIISVVLIF